MIITWLIKSVFDFEIVIEVEWMTKCNLNFVNFRKIWISVVVLELEEIQIN